MLTSVVFFGTHSGEQVRKRASSSGVAGAPEFASPHPLAAYVLNDKRRIRESDSKAEARGRTLGKKRTVMCITDIEAPRIHKFKIGATAKFSNAVA